MRPNLFDLSALLFIIAVAPCHGQDVSEIPPPKPPFVAPVPDRVDWILTVKGGEPPTPPAAGKHYAPHITEVHTTKTGSIRREEITESDGSKVIRFFVGTIVIWKDQKGTASASDLKEVEQPAGPEDPSPSVAEGFPGTKWLQLGYYDKVVAVQTRHCYHYKHGDLEAWIDTETKMPVAYLSGKTGYTFKFNDPPVESLSLPPDLQKAFDQYKSAMHRRQLLELPQMTRS